MLSTVMPKRSSALARLLGAPDHDVGLRGSPNTQVIATRSNRCTGFATDTVSGAGRSTTSTLRIPHATRSPTRTFRATVPRTGFRGSCSAGSQNSHRASEQLVFPAHVLGASMRCVSLAGSRLGAIARESSLERVRHLVYLTPDMSDTSTIKRVEEFAGQGYAVMVAGFRRDRYNRDYTPAWPHLTLGYTADGRYVHRAWAILLAVRALAAKPEYFRHATVLYCRNVDLLMLSTLVRALLCRDALLVYEILDVQPVLTGRGLMSRIVRAVERFCLRRVKVLVVSSPAFLRHYFQPVQGYRREWFLLENKVHPSAVTIDRNRPATPGLRRHNGADYRWVVGYVGLIRGNQTLDLISRLAARLRTTVLFKFRGVLTTVDPERFAAALAANPNIVYEGDYVNPRDLAHIYRDIDLAWALDLENVAHNSRWLLPCRFYEAGLYGVPCLAMREFEVGRLIDRLDVGWTFDEPLEEALAGFLETLTAAEHETKRRRLLAMPTNAFVTGDDIAALCQIFEREAADLPDLPDLPEKPLDPVVGSSL
ncbi:MAG: hypothetical protein JO021_08110 [Alphaproteobacteria bacterium]|nr:hypothetical protein [Alphaproteobacteria bacterium]